MSQFAENLKLLMSERNVTAKVLSEATGISPSTLSDWTQGREPKLTEAILKVARFFGVSIEFLLTGQEPEQRLVKDILQDEDPFVTIHKGVYRISIEKHKNS